MTKGHVTLSILLAAVIACYVHLFMVARDRIEACDADARATHAELLAAQERLKSTHKTLEATLRQLAEIRSQLP